MKFGAYIGQGRAIGGWLQQCRDFGHVTIVIPSIVASLVIAPGYVEAQQARPDTALPGPTQAPSSIQQQVAARVKKVVHNLFNFECEDLVITKIDEHPCGGHGIYLDPSNGRYFSEEAWWVEACGHLEVTQVRIYREPTGGASFKVFISGPCI